MGSEGGCSTSHWASLIPMLEMESVTSAQDTTIVEARAGCMIFEFDSNDDNQRTQIEEAGA